MARAAVEAPPPAVEPSPEDTVRSVRGVSTLLGDTASMLGSRMGAVVLSFASVLITTRLLHPVGYGRVAYFTVVAMLIFTITSAWSSTAVARYGREELETRGRLSRTSWSRIALIAPLFALAVVLVPLLKLAGAFPPEFTWTYVALVIVYGGLLVLGEHVRYLLEASGRMRLSALGTLVQQAAFVGAIGLIALTGASRSPLSVIVLSVLGLAAVTAVFGATVWSIAFWPPESDSAARRRMLLFSLPLVAFTASQYVIQAVDLIIIRAFKDPMQVGIYAFAYQAFTVLQGIATVAPQLLTPLFVSARAAHHEGLVRVYYDRVVRQVTLIASTLIGVVIALLPVVVPPLFGSDFENSVDPLAVLLFGVLLLILGNVTAPIIVLHERSRAMAVLSVIGAVVNVGGDVILLGPLHAPVVWAAVATTAGFAVIALGYYVVAGRCVDSRSRLPLPELAPAFFAAAATLALDGTAGVLAGVAATLLAAAAVVYVGRPFRADDMALFDELALPAPARRAAQRFYALVAR